MIGCGRFGAEERATSAVAFTPTRNKVIFVLRAGAARPRRIVRTLLSKRTASDYDVLLTHLARELDIETGTIKRLFTIYRRPVYIIYRRILLARISIWPLCDTTPCSYWEAKTLSGSPSLIFGE